jgi:hypothetical protein
MQTYIDIIRTIANKHKLSSSDTQEILMNLDLLEQELITFTTSSQAALQQSKNKNKKATNDFEDIISSLSSDMAHRSY